ncbi:homoserine dehydrogenase [Demetria terragena]|uniref:homoserine dehydrogenase n=1 Tax=Demetria terragena TaxID=63959 RepID=UPI000361D163|nr:homoserine dehydrogenase [Demetria terragena]
MSRTDSQGALRIALLGCGTVGSSVARRLLDGPEDFAQRIGRPIELVGIAVRDVDKARPGIPTELLTTDAEGLVADADLVVELMGGLEPARALILRAIGHGASVVTANKQLLGADGPSLYEAASAAGVDLQYEAAVAAAIPLIRPMRESLAGDHVRRVMGIVNGTTNFILDKMSRTGADLQDVLAEAQELGYAEADPTADVEGHDAQAKAAILASLAFHSRVGTDDVTCEGISQITSDDIRAVRKMGCELKLLAICERVVGSDGNPAVSARVHPTIIPRSHPLATVREAFNAVFVETELAGDLMFYGQGAGGDPTASAVLGDLVQAARHRVLGGRGAGESAYAALPILPLSDIRTRYAIRLGVKDEPGVLAFVATVFGESGISIESMLQGIRRSDDGLAPLTISTHEATEQQVNDAVARLRDLNSVGTVASVLRMEGIE